MSAVVVVAGNEQKNQKNRFCRVLKKKASTKNIYEFCFSNNSFFEFRTEKADRLNQSDKC